MSKWKCLNEEEKAIARARGLDPEGLVVDRTGGDLLVFLELKKRALVRETIVRRKRGEQNAIADWIGKKEGAYGSTI